MPPKTSFSLIYRPPFVMLVVFLAAFSLKLLIFFLATDPVIFYKYPYFVEKIVTGKDIGERILDLSPLYLYVNLLFYKIYGGNWEALAVLQIFLGSLNCVLIYLIGEKTFGKLVGLTAAFVLMLYGNLTLIELTLEPEPFVLFINSLVVLSLIHTRNNNFTHRIAWRWLLSGFLIGLSIITKPNALLLLPVAVIWIWLSNDKIINKIKCILFIFLSSALIIFPVTMRNYLKFQDFILITADGGKVLFHGNGPGGNGMARADLPNQGFFEEGNEDPDFAHAIFRKTARELTGRPLTPSECSRFWTSYTLNYIWKHPLPALILEIKKFFLFWGNYEVHDIDSTYKNYQTIQSWPLLPFGVLAAFGILGMLLALNKFRGAFLLYSLVFIYLLSVLIFFAASRYRLPAAPFLSVFAAYALISLFEQLRRNQTEKFILFSFILIGLWTAINLFFRHDVEIFDRWQKATRIHYSLGGNVSLQKGLYQEAAHEYQKALVLQPNFAPAHNRLGMCYALLNQLEKAEKHFQKVIALAPRIDQGYLNLGRLYILEGNSSKALPLLEKALALNPNNHITRKHLQEIRSRSNDQRFKRP